MAYMLHHSNGSQIYWGNSPTSDYVLDFLSVRIVTSAVVRHEEEIMSRFVTGPFEVTVIN
jgi:hypothetical protein